MKREAPNLSACMSVCTYTWPTMTLPTTLIPTTADSSKVRSLQGSGSNLGRNTD